MIIRKTIIFVGVLSQFLVNYKPFIFNFIYEDKQVQYEELKKQIREVDDEITNFGYNLFENQEYIDRLKDDIKEKEKELKEIKDENANKGDEE